MTEPLPPPVRQPHGRVLLVAAVAASAVVCAPTWLYPTRPSVVDDWLTFYALHAMMRVSVVEHGQFPEWAPWVGGGYPIAGHPELPNLTPLGLPSGRVRQAAVSSRRPVFSRRLSMRRVCVMACLVNPQGVAGRGVGR